MPGIRSVLVCEAVAVSFAVLYFEILFVLLHLNSCVSVLEF